MTGAHSALSADLAAAYVRELSTGVRAVLAQPEGMPDGVVVMPEGVVVVAGGVVAVMEPGALWSPTALDVAAVAQTPVPTLLADPSADVLTAARALLNSA